jgi:NADPH:quinone reductase-like Zn-dependent oxidoreductase
MKAVICTRYGPPEVLRLAEVERPTPRRNQICIRIFATAVTVSDCVIRGLKVPRRYRILLRLVWGVKAPRRPIIGMVLAGDVESVGRNVTSFKEGDQIFGFSR